MRTDSRSQLIRSITRHLIAGVAGTAVMLGSVGGWAATTEISAAVIAPGMMVVEGNAKRVQHPEGGVVAQVLVTEGETVQAGETIVRMDSTASEASLASVKKQIDQLYARQARLEAERDRLSEVPTPGDLRSRLNQVQANIAMASERRLFKDRRASNDGQKERITEQVQQIGEQIMGLDVQQQAKGEEIGLIEKELEGLRRLYEIGGITMSQLNALDRNAARLRGERGQLVASMASARGRIAELEVQRLQIDQQLRTEVAAEMRDVGNRLATLAEDEVTAQDRLRHAEIKAPIGGAVHLLAIHTVGGVVTPAETLMEIVPQDSRLTVEARIAPQDIDQVAIGQTSKLRLTAFNRNTTPELVGTVIRVSADLETNQTTGMSFYRIAIAIPGDELSKLKGLVLLPGMPVETFVRTGDRRVITYLSKPIRDHLQRVFRQD